MRALSREMWAPILGLEAAPAQQLEDQLCREMAAHEPIAAIPVYRYRDHFALPNRVVLLERIANVEPSFLASRTSNPPNRALVAFLPSAEGKEDRRRQDVRSAHTGHRAVGLRAVRVLPEELSRAH